MIIVAKTSLVYFFHFLLFSDFKTVIITGGLSNKNCELKTVESIGFNATSVDNLPTPNHGHCLVLTNTQTLLTFGGYRLVNKKCYAYQDNTWLHHSTLLKPRINSSAITMSDGVYVFGGTEFNYHKESEFLPNGSSTWQSGPKIPGLGVAASSIVKVSEHELVIIGGCYSPKQVLKYDTYSKTWTFLGNLNHERKQHSSAKLLDGNILITGGITNSSEVFNLSTMESRKTGWLREPRQNHGLSFVNFSSRPEMIVFGGISIYKHSYTHIDTIEKWNAKSWEVMPNLKLERRQFAYLTVPSYLLCP